MKINLKDMLFTLKKRFNLIAIITLVAVLISGGVSYFLLTPIYQASTQLLVNQSKNEQSMYQWNEVQTNLQLINTYTVIIKSPAVLDIVSKKLDKELSPEELNNKISVISEKNSQVFNVTVNDPDPLIAAEIANKTAEVFQKEIVKIMSVDNVSILAKAKVGENPTPVSPKPLLNITLALVVGMVTGVGLAFLLEFLDNTVKNEQEAEKILGLPVLGVIATISEPEMVAMKNRRMDRKSGLRGETIGS